MPLEYLLVAGVPENASISFKKGVARLEEGKAEPRNFDDYYHNVLLPQIAKGTIEERDLKLRFSGYKINQDVVIFTGPTSFQEYREAFTKQLPNTGLIKRLKAEGKQAAGDKWARLARPLGLTAAVIDATDAYLVGKRKPREDGRGVTEYGNFLHFPAGYLPFNENPAKIDWTEAARKFVKRDYNIGPESIERMRARLIASHPETGETDIVVDVLISQGCKLNLNTNKYVSLYRVERKDVKVFAASHNLAYPTAALLAQSC